MLKLLFLVQVDTRKHLTRALARHGVEMMPGELVLLRKPAKALAFKSCAFQNKPIAQDFLLCLAFLQNQERAEDRRALIFAYFSSKEK